jgi:hypothetical protein
MPILTIEGVYRDGQVELTERPEGVGALARVLVIFLPPPAKPGPTPEDLRREAGGRLLALLGEGLPLGGPPYPSREDLHDRVNLFDATRDG